MTYLLQCVKVLFSQMHSNAFQIVDLAVDHPSCSKQHAVLQYRLVDYEREDGTAGRKCK